MKEETTKAYYLSVQGKGVLLSPGHHVPSDCYYYDKGTNNVYNNKRELIGYGEVLKEIFN